MGQPSTVEDITDAVMYLTDAVTVTGHILYVDGGSHFGRPIAIGYWRLKPFSDCPVSVSSALLKGASPH
jgi:hypothetical protein